MDFYLNALALGLAMTAMCWGIFITLKIFNFPDITTDGSYTLGAACSAALIYADWNPVAVLLIATLSGAIAGIATGLIHTKLKVNPLLAGILVMTALYSVNLAVMGKSNIPLLKKALIFNFEKGEPASITQILLIAAIILLILGIMLIYLFRTDYGLAMRATGNNALMMKSFGVNTHKMKIAGLAIANALTALSGSLVSQLQGFADINMGIGIVIFGLGAVMIGETFAKLTQASSIASRLVFVLVGCLIFRLIVAYALSSGIDPNWLKAITALIVLIFVSIPIKSKRFTIE